MRKLFITSLLILGVSANALAQQAMSSLINSADPVSLGHAGAAVALEANAFALENNTAAMSFYEGRMDAALAYQLWQPGGAKDNVVNVGVFGRIGKRIAIGAEGKFVMQKPYQITDGDGIAQQVNGTFRPGENNFALGVSCLITDYLSAGVNLKVATSKLAPSAKACAFASDIYAAYKSNFGLTAGLGICNLGTKAKYSEESVYSLPSYLRVGAAYKIVGVSVDAEFDYMFSNAIMAGVSASYWYKDYVGISCGYHYGSDKSNKADQTSEIAVTPLCIPSYLSLGLGAQFKGVHLDLAYLTASKVLGNTICLSLGYRF